MAAVSDPEAEMEPALDKALVEMADDFISGAVAFGSGLARRRKSSKLDAADVSVYLEQTWYVFLSQCLSPALIVYIVKMRIGVDCSKADSLVVPEDVPF